MAMAPGLLPALQAALLAWPVGPSFAGPEAVPARVEPAPTLAEAAQVGAGLALVRGDAALSEAAGPAQGLARRAQGLRRPSAKASPGRALQARARLCYSPEEILSAMASHMGLALRAEVPLPTLRYESEVPLREFQDAMERQWRERPAVFINAFAEDSNTIFLIDEPGYYSRLGRWVDDSLAHEYVHYLQLRYRGQRMVPEDETLEVEAVYAQSWFRDAYLRSPAGAARCGGAPGGAPGRGPAAPAGPR